MKISEKIGQIRRAPEHIRLNYVWGSVAISMLFILAIWIFSLGSLFQEEKGSNKGQPIVTEDIAEQLKNIKEQASSIKDIPKQERPLEIEKESITSMENESIRPTTDINRDLQENSYSDLSTAPISQ